MGLIDVLNGMQNGPHGPRGSSGRGGGGMSPITMAILGLLAYKALKSFTSQPATAAPAPSAPAPTPGGSAGGLGDILKGGLGGLLAGGAAGSVLSGGLNDLLKQFQQAGHGDVAKSWVGTGPNKTISPDDLAKRSRRRPDQRVVGAFRIVARRFAGESQPVSAAGCRSSDARLVGCRRSRKSRARFEHGPHSARSLLWISSSGEPVGRRASPCRVCQDLDFRRLAGGRRVSSDRFRARAA